MPTPGWKQLLANRNWFRRPGRYPIPAYSEFLPSPRPAGKSYPLDVAPFFDADDPFGWPITEAEERLEIQPGLQHVAQILVHALADLAAGKTVRGLTRRKLTDNPAWPAELSASGMAAHERFLVLTSLALSRTQDDKGRVRWTVFGSSDLGPGRAFWRSFWLTPRKAVPAEVGRGFIRRILHNVYGIGDADAADLKKAGFRILPQATEKEPWADGPLPSWTEPLLCSGRTSVDRIRYLLTFRPFAELPNAVRDAYLAGKLHLLPCPHSLLFWGAPNFRRLAESLPEAWQIPLLHLLPRSENIHGLRIPQSGWMHEPSADHPAPEDPAAPLTNTYRRTHRWAKIHRHEDELAVTAKEDKLAHVLFSTAGDDLGLYGKPMARNVQIWENDGRLILDGPQATSEELHAAAERVKEGGVFGYRFQFPPMMVGRHEVFWHRPLAAYRPAGTADVQLLDDAPTGIIIANGKPDRVELWPRIRQRPERLAALGLFHRADDPHPNVTSLNVRKLFRAAELRREPLPRTMARQLLSHNHGRSLAEWLAALPGKSDDESQARSLVVDIEKVIEPETGQPPEPLTYSATANRSFEVRYWKLIAQLSTGRFMTKSNADCVLDKPTQSLLHHHHRDLDALGDFILRYYERTVRKAEMSRRAIVGELPFIWKTDFDFSWMGGWLHNQEGTSHERDLICVIPGRDRSRAVIMADHYDTAYMSDKYEPDEGGTGARLAAAGADDNCSATAALMLGAPIFLNLSRRGKLACDIWLVHLTGEEFPSDCLGARHLARSAIERTLKIHTPTGKQHDISDVTIQGLYVLDMVAHNNDREGDVFQIAPGVGRQSLWLAEQAHLANEMWNAGTMTWNRRKDRRGLGRGQRSKKPSDVPATAAHPALNGEIRLSDDPRSTLYNTDGQIFSDAGIPCVLFMENYDINRMGYHDTQDTMENIDLDYGSALAAIAIESVARAATEKPPK